MNSNTTYNVIIIDDALDKLACGDYETLLEDRKGEPDEATIRRAIYEKLLYDPGITIKPFYMGKTIKPADILEYAKTAYCDAIILDEELKDMRSVRDNGKVDDFERAVDTTEKVLKALSGINGGYSAHPPIMRVTGRDGEERTLHDFVRLQRLLDDKLLEFTSDCGRTYFINSLINDDVPVVTTDIELSFSGTGFQRKLIDKCKDFYEKRELATQPAVLVTYVNAKELAGIKEVLKKEKFKLSSNAEALNKDDKVIHYDKYEKLIADKYNLAVYLLCAGPGLGSFLKQTISFIMAQRKFPIRISCVITAGVAFAIRPEGDHNTKKKDVFVAISKRIIDSDMERLVKEGRVPVGETSYSDPNMVNMFKESAEELAEELEITVDDIVVASADKLYKLTEAVEVLADLHPSATVGDMEARGILFLLRANPQLVKYGIMVKGISDKGDEDKDDKLQKKASNRAFQVISKTITNEDFIRKFLL